MRGIDGVDQTKIKRIHTGPIHRAQVFMVDSIVRGPKVAHKKIIARSYIKPAHALRPKAGTDFNFFKNFVNTFNLPELREKWNWVYNQKRVPVLVAVVALFLAFGSGILATLNTNKTQADLEPQVLGAYTDTPAVAQNKNFVVPIETAATLGPINNVPNDVLFNMTIDQLEGYLASAVTTPEAKEAQLLSERKEKLTKYLNDKKSPLVEIVPTLAELKHWKMVLAISNSESSLGRHCAGKDNNCSGIGVEPGHPLWRTYNTKADWAKDLDRLLEKRYKDWTLEEMNGTYNKPGSANWLMASKQILEDLQERDIE